MNKITRGKKRRPNGGDSYYCFECKYPGVKCKVREFEKFNYENAACNYFEPLHPRDKEEGNDRNIQ